MRTARILPPLLALVLLGAPVASAGVSVSFYQARLAPVAGCVPGITAITGLVYQGARLAYASSASSASDSPEQPSGESESSTSYSCGAGGNAVEYRVGDEVILGVKVLAYDVCVAIQPQSPTAYRCTPQCVAINSGHDEAPPKICVGIPDVLP